MAIVVYIVVQLPEPHQKKKENAAFAINSANLAHCRTHQRTSAVAHAKKIKEENPLFAGDSASASSSSTPPTSAPGNRTARTSRRSLLDAADHLKTTAPNRTSSLNCCSSWASTSPSPSSRRPSPVRPSTASARACCWSAWPRRSPP